MQAAARMLRARGAQLLLVLLAALLMLPALLGPEMRHDSFWIDMVWSEQFTAGLRAGNPYPRWLPLSYGELGSPAFYFYAPLSFHAAALFGLLGLDTYPALLATFAAAWAASGLAMYAWLRGETKAPLAGAALYMALPYHVMDFYGRGALAEFCAFAVVPLVAIGVRKAVRDGRHLPLALAYAALVMTHLPTAVIVSALLVVPLSLWEARAELRRLRAAIVGVVAGIALAAVYLVPALTLQEYSSVGALWAVGFLQPASWSLLRPDLWVSPNYVLLFAGLAGVAAFAALVIGRAAPRFWVAWTIAICVVVAGLVPGFWSLPVLKAVQFPWRSLVLAEFGLATLVACHRGSPVVATAALTPLLAFSWMMANPANPLHGEPMRPLPVSGLQDVIEYLPPGAVGPDRRPRVRLIHQAALRARLHDQTAFRFPSAQARCDDGTIVPLIADANNPLIGAPPAGCRLSIERLPAERIGAAVSLAAVLLLGLAALGRTRRNAMPPPPIEATSAA